MATFHDWVKYVRKRLKNGENIDVVIDDVMARGFPDSRKKELIFEVLDELPQNNNEGLEVVQKKQGSDISMFKIWKKIFNPFSDVFNEELYAGTLKKIFMNFFACMIIFLVFALPFFIFTVNVENGFFSVSDMFIYIINFGIGFPLFITGIFLQLLIFHFVAIGKTKKRVALINLFYIQSLLYVPALIIGFFFIISLMIFIEFNLSMVVFSIFIIMLIFYSFLISFNFTSALSKLYSVSIFEVFLISFKSNWIYQIISSIAFILFIFILIIIAI